MIKKRVVSIVISTLTCMPSALAIVDSCCKQQHHRSFLYTHPLNQNMSMNRATWDDYLYEKHGTTRTAVQMYGSYQQSLNTSSANRYFLFNCKENLLVAGDSSIDKKTRDVRAEWFGLPSSFSGTLALKPKQHQAGLFFEIHQDIDKIIKLSFLQDYWIDICLPIMMVENTLTVDEHVEKTASNTAFATMTTALQNPARHYANALNKPQSLIRLGEISIKFGRAYLAQDHYHITYYSGFSLPTANKQDAKNIFAPVVGNNGHFGIIAGVNFQIVTTRCDCPYTGCLFLTVENLFLCKNEQRRTLDLKNNPWSRYLVLNKKDEGPEQFIPAANVLTRDVLVHPYSIVDVSVGGRLLYGGLNVEVGYNLWAHGSEKIELKHCFPAVWAIAGIKDPARPLATTSASKSTICEQASNDVDSTGAPLFTPIKEHDLDLSSGGTKNALTHKVHISIGWGNKGCSFDGFIGIGGWYEFPHDFGALKTAGAWIKFGGAF